MRDVVAHAQEVFWMAAAMINARDNTGQFAALVDIVRHWPERKVCALADRLVPAPGGGQDRAAAIAAIEQLSCGAQRDVADRLSRVGQEIAATSSLFRDRSS